MNRKPFGIFLFIVGLLSFFLGLTTLILKEYVYGTYWVITGLSAVIMAYAIWYRNT